MRVQFWDGACRLGCVVVVPAGGTSGWGRSGGGGRLGRMRRRARRREGGDCGERKCRRSGKGFYSRDASMQTKYVYDHGRLLMISP